ncbi:MAG: 2-succinyl-5-enolpyruvyl-6-hydroxy-3-cyclohexene-1-carboxylic-acid synthase [Dehalococcoidia bacterium]|nr:2-succinyl-5-enolpyruvyl-6-hydroxy-3-cyclohexene-1-carboxylic-acid synthase [Dehalococcoidia bacterium]
MGADGTVTAGNALYAFIGAFFDELARAGVRDVCVCPGSRSTPLSIMARRHPDIRTWVHLDERSAGFFALGMAKARRAPVALICTSGTAAVNFAPAVVEACYGRVPLIVLTADRPPELRDVGALQTIDQRDLYGKHAKWFAESILPEGGDEAIRYVRTLAGRAAATAREGAPGPVHLNFPFREPLIPEGSGPPPGAREDGRPYVEAATAGGSLEQGAVAVLAADLRRLERGLIIAGPQESAEFPAAIGALAEALGYPLLADPLSGLRCGPHPRGAVIEKYDAFLRDPAAIRSLAPEVVLRFGATPVSKPLQGYLQHHAGTRQVLVDDPGKWDDFAFLSSDVFHAEPLAFVRALSASIGGAAGAPPTRWLAYWRSLDGASRDALAAALAERDALSEPAVFADLASLLPDGAALFAGNSMPVRDLDSFFDGGERAIRLMASRGASGIDGVVSTALGASTAIAQGGPLVLVIGDISFYHDMSGLLAARRYGLNATIVLINNDGGGIFSFLPQQEQAGEHFEELFGTPHGLDFRPAAELYGLDYHLAGNRDEFRAAVGRSLAAPGVAIVEVRTERGANLRLHHELMRTVSTAIGPLLPEGGGR